MAAASFCAVALDIGRHKRYSEQQEKASNAPNPITAENISFVLSDTFLT